MSEYKVNLPSPEEYDDSLNEFLSGRQIVIEIKNYIKEFFPEAKVEDIELASEIVMKAVFAGLTLLRSIPTRLLYNPNNEAITIDLSNITYVKFHGGAGFQFKVGDMAIIVGYSNFAELIRGYAEFQFKVGDMEYKTLADIPEHDLDKAVITHAYALVNTATIMGEIRSNNRISEAMRDIFTGDKLEESTTKIHGKRTLELIRNTESTMAHEIGHVLYVFQTTKNISKKNMSKVKEWKELIQLMIRKFDHKDKYGRSMDISFQNYKENRGEQRADIWKRLFQRKYHQS